MFLIISHLIATNNTQNYGCNVSGNGRYEYKSELYLYSMKASRRKPPLGEFARTAVYGLRASSRYKDY
jgi:hypothetical protein